MRTADFDFDLPEELIAQWPLPERDRSRLFVLHRDSGRFEHREFRDLPDYLRAGDVLVLNDSRVVPARLRARNQRTGGRFEILLLEENAPNDWWAMLKPARRARVGTTLQIQQPDGAPANLSATVLATNDEGHRRLQFHGVPDVWSDFFLLGLVPLPPYIHRNDGARAGPSSRGSLDDRERYQTVYATRPGSVAAPTAGLHFTPALLERIRAAGVEVCFVTLHVGLGTFAPVKAETPAGHKMHEERYEVSADTARAVNSAKAEGRRVVAVGTTSLRVLESVAAAHQGRLVAGHGRTRLFVYPPYEVTNFHLPRSTLLMLVSAFAAPGQTRGRDLILAAYAEAVRRRYRFFSYGDAMFIL
ncbi:MAG: tRNA preQ1(34) S-adenosylmethionine ribosyltransferase-isomerase QueA [Verrucomicrobiales bacterium]|nr:tRNA preQ1(34) S-adenosylmethionine ribosyltransferase-isomerase QueA [Verrucomicrobiales bacterium]